MKLTISFPEHATRTGVTRSPASLAMTSVLPSLNKWQKWITARFYTKKINKPPQSKWFSTLQMAKDAQVYPRWTPIAAAMLIFKEREKLGRTPSESLSAIPGHTFDWMINERPFSPKFRENKLLGLLHSHIFEVYISQKFQYHAIFIHSLQGDLTQGKGYTRDTIYSIDKIYVVVKN